MTKLCEYCGLECDELTLTPIKLGPRMYHVCTACISIRLRKCDDCEGYYASLGGTYTPFDSLTSTYGTKKKVCQRCFHATADRYRQCGNSCGRTIDMQTPGSYIAHGYDSDTRFCLHCSRDLLAVCPVCNKQVYTSYIERSNGITACDNCRQNLSPERHLHSYSHKPTPLFHLTDGERLGSEMDKYVLDSSCDTSRHLFLGVELEIDDGVWGGRLAKQLKLNWPLVYPKKDGSLSSMGIEIVSYPATLAFHKEAFGWDRLCNLCKSAKYKSGDTVKPTGIHIHFNRSFLGKQAESFCLKLTSFIHAHPNYIERLAGRKNEQYATLKPVRRIKDLSHIKNSRNRHDAVNFTNEHTIEIRIFKGSLNPNTIKGYLEIVDGLVRFLKTTPASMVVESDPCWRAYCSFIKKSGYDFARMHLEISNAWRV